ncbi:acetate kinase [Rhodanobacter sp. C06]|uniref:acetate/propionate family kinase n=1 Tax=Rhodanobacter sp. C06 TaxID=1945854 RepID=UPI00098680B3|nr:acetate/propionate family kinase [Rhodanobacter sp. C06]OOG37691.1 acetate kinase [Rhodanobacter sp. C06]
MKEAILALNVGSSSLKLAAFDATTLDPVLRAGVTGIGCDARATFEMPVGIRPDTPVTPAIANIEEAAHWLLDILQRHCPDLHIVAAGHRVVHGGTRFDRPVRIDAAVLAGLEALMPLAPAHQPAAIAVIRSMSMRLPGTPQIACFDTAFHRTQPKLSQWYALPRAMSEAGIVRIGFHGISYEYVASVLSVIAGSAAHDKVVVAHLGHGASVCAMRDLRSVATSMGLTPLDGLMMGTRCGAIDPGVLLHLLQEQRMGVQELADLLGNRSGLLGVSGISDDVQVLEASDDPRAREALDMFAERAACTIAAQAPLLDGLQALVFTGGIGEHASGMRRRICDRLAWLGLTLDEDANLRHARRIDREDASVRVYVIPTNEEIVIARAVRRVLLC